jgi:selenocysteine-specific elongation factor
MEIQPVVVGTAGHIDHGKSSLVRALTGIDPDRLKEEKERGLTIDLGFANFALPDGRRVGIVDVPGHERFIRNMAAGASGIDLVVLVVAADDGVMPQTREHLQILELLGVHRGFVALTKVDAVDTDLVELAAEDVAELVRGTFLEGAPVHRVSSITGEGIEELRATLSSLAAEAPTRDDRGVFRMPVQRVFSKAGFGTVVTGIPVSGSAQVGDVLEILPAGAKGKVRSIQAYGGEAPRARAGHSSAINLAGLELAAVRRGDVVATPGAFRSARMIGARLSVLADAPRPVTNRMPVRLHAGTSDPSAEVVLLDAEELAPGATGLVQLRLDEPIVVAPGDRFVLRLLSPVETLGGGVVIEESRHRLKRFKGFVLEELSEQEQSLSSPRDFLEAVLHRAGDAPVPLDELSTAAHLPREEAAALLAALAGENRAFEVGKGAKGGGWMHAERLDEALARLTGAVDAWFEEQPHRAVVEALELRRRLGWDGDHLAVLLRVAVEREALELQPGGRVRPAGRGPVADDPTRALAEEVHAALHAAAFRPPSLDELVVSLGRDVPRALELLADESRALRLGSDLVLSAERVAEARAAVEENCERNGALAIPELRDRLGTTRKFLIPLLEHFDAIGLTARQGSHRVLRRR